MTTITPDELTTLKRKIGNGAAGFTDPDLDLIWVEAGESMSKSLFIAFEELMNDAARFNDYTQNDTQEKRSQVYDHLVKNVAYWKAKVAEEDLAANPLNRAARIFGTRVIPPRRIERPYTDGDPDCDRDRTWP